MINIHRIEIGGYRCFEEVSANLKPFTVLIGPNGSGKTSFVACLQDIVAKHVSNEQAFASKDRPLSVLLHYSVNGVPRTFRQSWSRQARLMTHGDPYPGVMVGPLRLPSSGVRLECQGSSDRDRDVPLPSGDGQNLAAIIDWLLRNDREGFDQLIGDSRDLIPGFEDLSIACPDPSTRRIDLTVDGVRVAPANASVGFRSMLCFLTLSRLPIDGLLVVEEPENGLHPGALEAVMGVLRSISARTQVVITTHSPYLLDSVRLDTDQLLVFKRDPKSGRRTITPANPEVLSRFSAYSLGEVWGNIGEDGITNDRS